jgi:hypothetical protein
MDYVDCKLTILDEEQTLYSDRFRPDPISGRIRDDQDGDTLVRDTIERLDAWVASDDRDITRDDLELLGRHLYYFLFDDKIRNGFEQTYQGFRQSPDKNARLRLVLAFHEEAKRIASYPWEFLFMPTRKNSPGFFLCAEKRTELILTRLVPESSLADKLFPEETSLKILVVFANPRELRSPLHPEKFLEQISSTKRVDVEIMTEETNREALTKDGLERELRRFKPHIFHFIGHGDAAKGVALMKTAHEVQEHYDATGETRDAEWVDSRALSRLFPDPPPRLVFLHACDGAAASSLKGFNSTAHALVYSYDVPAVVAMQYVITNESAALFAKTFYQQIADGKPIDIAVSEGRWALRQSRGGEFADRGFGTPLVYLQNESAIILHQIDEEEEGETHVPCPYGCGGRVFAGNSVCGKCVRPLTICEQGHVMAAGSKACPQGHPARDAGVARATALSAPHESQVETGRGGSAPELLQPVPEPAGSDPLRTTYDEAKKG